MVKRLFVFSLLILSLSGCVQLPEVSIPEPRKLEQLEPGTHLRNAVVQDVGKVNYTIRIPNQYDGETAKPLMLLLHYGYSGSKPEPFTGQQMINAFEKKLPKDLFILAPDVVESDWKHSKNEAAAVWLVQSMLKTYNIDESQVLICGFSMGGEGAWYIGSRHQDLFTGVIPIAAPVAGQKDSWQIPIYVVHSKDDEVVPYFAARRHSKTVEQNGAVIKFKAAEGVDHYNAAHYRGYLPDALFWIQEH